VIKAKRSLLAFSLRGRWAQAALACC